VRGFFKGFTCPLLGQGAVNATVFGVESLVYTRLRRGAHKTLSVTNSAIAGMCAGAVQTIIVCPVELLKIRLQNQFIGRKLHPVQSKVQPIIIAREIFRNEGIKGIFRGWWITLLREVPQYGIYFGTYAWMRKYFADITKTSPEELGILPLSLAGGVTGVVTWCWYPVDVIKTRLQYNRTIDDKALRYNGITDCVVRSYQSEGPMVFMKGFQLTIIRGFLNGFVTLPVFTLAMQFLHSQYV
jgi:solute carrier family 25 carnitine/acylcarnitine transporter 20/29